jgi:hypothetical protein
VLRIPGERYLPAYVMPTVNLEEVALQCGMCFSWPGFDPHNTAQKYKRESIQGNLTGCILSVTEDQFGDDDFLSQHDSAPCHKSRSVREWFVDNKVPEMDWPGQNPDLSRIEHLWDKLELRLCSRPQRPTTLTALAAAL